MKTKILVIGNYTDAMYHPLGGVDEELKKIFPDIELFCTDETKRLLDLKTEKIAGVISYLDIWNGQLTDTESEALYSFVAEGGALLILHNGISIQSQDKLKIMMGGKFITHPPMEKIEFKVKSHEITMGCEDFYMEEEPYQFELEEDDKEIFLTYIYRKKEYAAGWSKCIGKGHIVFLTPGHTAGIFKNTNYIKLIQNSMQWLLK